MLFLSFMVSSVTLLICNLSSCFVFFSPFFFQVQHAEAFLVHRFSPSPRLVRLKLKYEGVQLEGPLYLVITSLFMRTTNRLQG